MVIKGAAVVVDVVVVVVVGFGSKQQSSVESKLVPTQLSLPHSSVPEQSESSSQSPSPSCKQVSSDKQNKSSRITSARF